MLMKDEEKTKDQLIEELEEIRGQVATLRAAELYYRQKDEALRKSAQEIQDLYDNAPCGYHSLDKDGVFVNINNTELSWLGYIRDEIIGRKFYDVITTESLNIFKENFSRFKEQGFVQDLEFELIRKDGSLMPVLLSATAIKDDAGNFVMSRSTLFNITDRKQVARALIESEKRYRLLIENSSDLIYTINLRGYFIYVNPVAEHIMGWPISEIVGKHYLSFVGPDFHEEIIAFYKKQYDEHIPSTYFEYPIITGDWETRWIGQNVQLLSVNGKVTGFQAVARDITDRRQVEEALRESETKLQAVFDTVGTGIIIIDKDTQIIIEANQTALDMIGLPKEGIIGQICHSLICPAQAGRCPIKDLGQSVDHSERTLLCADGPLKDILKTVHPITIKGRDCYLESFIDITDLKAAEQKMASLNKEFEEVNRQLGLAYTQMKDNRDQLRKHLFEEEIGFLVDRDGLIKGVGQKILEHTGKSRNELIGISLTDVFHENCRKIIMAELRQAWIGIASRISVEMTSTKEDDNHFEMKMTRITLDDKQLLLVLLR